VSALNMTVQLELDGPLGASVQGSGATAAVEPAGWLVKLKSTVPAGALLVPDAVSVTVTVQLAGVFAGVEAGQASVVEVERPRTEIVSLPELPECTEAGAGS
jgi:hypothetical protein